MIFRIELQIHLQLLVSLECRGSSGLNFEATTGGAENGSKGIAIQQTLYSSHFPGLKGANQNRGRFGESTGPVRGPVCHLHNTADSLLDKRPP